MFNVNISLKKSFLLNKHCKITTLPTWVNKSHVSVRCSTIFYSHATFDIHWKTLNWVLLSIFSVYTQIKLCFFYYHNVFLFSRRIFFDKFTAIVVNFLFRMAFYFKSLLQSPFCIFFILLRLTPFRVVMVIWLQNKGMNFLFSLDFFFVILLPFFQWIKKSKILCSF